MIKVKWADYVITAVKFKKEKRHIEYVKVRLDDGAKLLAEQIILRADIISAIERDISFATAYQKDGLWHIGDNVGIVVVDNIQFIRTDGNSKEEDNLGALPEF
jgi:hypothetical protein